MQRLFILAGLLATGCAAAPELEPKSAPATEAESPPPLPAPEAPTTSRRLGGPPRGERTSRTEKEPKERPKDYLPFIDVAMDPEAVNKPGDLPLEDRYTRLKIVSRKVRDFDTEAVKNGDTSDDDKDRSYRDESRSWFSRMLGSKEVTRVLLTEFDLSKPNITTSEALFSSSFSSNNQEGESWETKQNIAIYATPWFKVSSDTTLTTNVKMQLADQRTSSGASTGVLNSLSTAANLIAPSSQLVTYFTEPAINTASNFLNGSVSSLFGRAITEMTTGSMTLKTWREETAIIEISAALPDPDDIRKTSSTEKLGGWAVFLDEPILSVFTNATSFDPSGSLEVPNFHIVAGADVLNYTVSNDLKLYDYIFSRLDLADRIDLLNASGSTDTARQICNRIDRGLTEVGLNTWDAAAGVYAAATSDQFNLTAQRAMTYAQTCDAMRRYQMANPAAVLTAIAPAIAGSGE